MRVLVWLSCLSFLSACAVEKKGILVDVEPGTPVDQSDILKHCDLGDSAACALTGSKDTPPPQPSFAILQGVAPPDRAVFAILQPKTTTNLSWFLYDRDVNSLRKLYTVRPITRGNSAWALQRLDLQGLLPNRAYELLAGDSEGHLIEDRKFHPLDTDEKPLRIALLGGLRFASHAERTRILELARARAPQLFVLAGSITDATFPGKLENTKAKAARDFFFERHAEARASLDLGLERSLIPVAAQWNDDDYGRAEGDQSFAQRDQSREMFELFFPHWADEATIVNGPGIALAIEFRSQVLALIDDLSFRKGPTPGESECHKPKGRKTEVCKPGKPIPAPAGTRYGSIQRDWVAGRAAKAPHPLWLLAGGSNLLPFNPAWTDDPVLASQELSRPRKAAWLSIIESSKDGTLHFADLNQPPAKRP